MTPLSDDQYKPDFEILDRYLKFSSELLRISLMAMGGFGAILLAKLKHENTHVSLGNLDFLFISICFFGLCSVCSLFHRFYASDCMSWHIAHLRAKNIQNDQKAEREKKGLHKMLHRASISLILAEFAFGIAIFFFAIGIYRLIAG